MGGKPEGKYSLKELVLHGRIILKWIQLTQDRDQ
jgi:hypothetical protein